MEKHPVRFTPRQIEFIQHMMEQNGYDYWEEECVDLEETIIKAEHNIKEN